MKNRSPEVRAARAFADHRRAVAAYFAGRLPLERVFVASDRAAWWTPKWWRSPSYRPRMDRFCFPKGFRYRVVIDHEDLGAP